LNWYTGSVYNLQFENESFDLVHASFLFIHLLKPFLAIREAYRVLKPGGLMYITDVNDDTFQGPQEIVDMVNSHDDMYEGNRRIMRDLDYLASQGGFELLHAHKVVANNTGYDGDLSFENGEMKLGKNTMWAMFSFMGQRDEIKDKFNKAQDVYFSNKDTVISIETHTRVYKKL
jgi:SAM-dependent methyltransferase